MILKILGVADQEDKTKQCLRLKVTADGNLSDYAIVDTTFKDGIPSNLHQHYYSFPNHPVKDGDFVWLYSTSGTDKTRSNVNETTTHVFYWDLDISVWNTVDTAHLLQIVDSSDRKIESKK